jgi:hypothetical protein
MLLLPPGHNGLFPVYEPSDLPAAFRTPGLFTPSQLKGPSHVYEQQARFTQKAAIVDLHATALPVA